MICSILDPEYGIDTEKNNNSYSFLHLFFFGALKTLPSLSPGKGVLVGRQRGSPAKGFEPGFHEPILKTHIILGFPRFARDTRIICHKWGNISEPS